MTWNYRVVEIAGAFEIHEVYYDDQGRPNMYSENGSAPYGTTLEELISDYKMMQFALTKRVLTPKDFVHESEDDDAGV